MKSMVSCAEKLEEDSELITDRQDYAVFITSSSSGLVPFSSTRTFT